jgi:hypothetical protein
MLDYNLLLLNMSRFGQSRVHFNVFFPKPVTTIFLRSWTPGHWVLRPVLVSILPKTVLKKWDSTGLLSTSLITCDTKYIRIPVTDIVHFLQV